MTRRLLIVLLILGIASVFIAVPVFCYSYNPSENLEVDFLDIGQGDSILIKTPFGQNILIDGGPDNKVITRLSENLPWWDRTIDLMILSHPHDDHVFGLNDVLKRYEVKKVLYTGVIHNSPGFINWLELIREKNIPLIIIDRPQKIALGNECNLEILYPLTSFLGEEVANLNNSSIIARLIYKETKFLFTGDAEVEVENQILEKYDRMFLQADVYKVCHHGSDTSSSEDFLKAINPKYAIIQVGNDNSFGHPSRRILKRLERIGAKIYRNDIDGTVKVISDGKKVEVR